MPISTPERMELRGDHAHRDELAADAGDAAGRALTAKAPVDVVVAPLRLELTPAGPVDLPLGQMMRLQGWAHYSGGRLVAVPGERLKWHDRQDAEAGPGHRAAGR